MGNPTNNRDGLAGPSGAENIGGERYPNTDATKHYRQSRDIPTAGFLLVVAVLAIAILIVLNF